MKRLLMHLAGEKSVAEPLAAALRERISGLNSRRTNAGADIRLSFAVAGDPLANRSQYLATVDIRDANVAELVAVAQGFVSDLGDLVNAAASTSLVGENHVFLAGDPCAIRYQHLMVRKPGRSRESFLAYYRDAHSQFGVATPGIESYVQFHVDPAASERLAKVTGAGRCDFDAVSELHLASIDGFLAAVAASGSAGEASADEATFADRRRTVGFCSRIDEQTPAGA